MRQSSTREAVRPRCLPKPPRVLNGAVNARGAIKLRCPRMWFPGGRVGCGGGRRGRWPLRLISDDNERGNDDDDGVYNDATSAVNSNSKADVAAGAQGGSFLPDMPSHKSTYLRTSGSSRASGLANSTKRRCNLNAAYSTTTSPSLPPYNSVLEQASPGEERDAGWGETSISQRQPRRAALKQRELLKHLLQEDQL